MIDKKSFRHEIQGLRAVAVLLVVIFHLEPTLLTGGYIGVDIFFVISGFLITRIIKNEIETTGKFSFGEFYLNRAKRLLPALLIIITATLMVAYIIMTPQSLSATASSAFSSLFYFSNLFFWNQSGYFDANAITKPLLHTWSLSVEEQFYIVWPVLLLLASFIRYKHSLSLTIVLMGALSLGAIYIFDYYAVKGSSHHILKFAYDNSHATQFFWMPFRIFEFSIGALLAIHILSINLNQLWSTLLQATGLVFILISAVVFTGETKIPGIIALVPCVGAALVIIGGTKSITSKVLTSQILTRIGNISYSMYLVHWPIIVFYQYYTLQPFSPFQIIALFIFIYITSEFLYVFFENRFRKRNRDKNSNSRFLATITVSTTACCTFIFLFAKSGMPERFSEKLPVENFNTASLQQETVTYNNLNIGNGTFGDGKKILIIGDSHGRDISNGLHQNLNKDTYSIRYISINSFCLNYLKDHIDEGKKDLACKDSISELLTTANVSAADNIIISFDWLTMTYIHIDKLIYFISTYRPINETILLLGSSLHFDNFPEIAFKFLINGKTTTDINKKAYTVDRSEKDMIDGYFSTFAKDNGILFRKKIALMCAEETCAFISGEKKLLVWDDAHWTLEGASIFSGRLIDSNPNYFK